MRCLAFFLFLIPYFVSVSSSVDHEFGVDREKDQNDPAYKYKIPGNVDESFLKIKSLFLSYFAAVMVDLSILKCLELSIWRKSPSSRLQISLNVSIKFDKHQFFNDKPICSV